MGVNKHTVGCQLDTNFIPFSHSAASLTGIGDEPAKVQLSVDTGALGMSAIKEATRLPEIDVLAMRPDNTIELDIPAATATVLRFR